MEEKTNVNIEQTTPEEKPLKLKRLEKKKLRVINKLIAGEINGPQAEIGRAHV